MTDTTATVAAGVQAYADAEAALLAAHDALLKLPAVYAAISASRPDAPDGVPAFTYFEGQKRGSAARQLAADVDNVRNTVITMHQDDTTRAQALLIDLPAPPSPGGVHPDGGGR